MATKRRRSRRRRKQSTSFDLGMLLKILTGVLAVLLVLVIVLLVKKKLTGNQEAATLEETTTQETSTEETASTETVDTDYFEHDTGISYLTGTALEEDLVNQRPFAVMIENTKECLPQYGISNAGVIYECPVEGSYTRMMAIFDDCKDVPKIGNVRSCRDYFAYIAREYEAIYAHYGQSIYAEVGVLASGLVDNLNGLDGSVGDLVYYRTSDRKAPHNVYTDYERLLKGAEKKGYSLTYSSDYQGHFKFADTTNTLSDGEQVYVIKPYYFYNHPYFIYNEDDQLYYRYEFGSKQVDGNNSSQLTVTNVIFQYVKSSTYDQTEYLNIPTTGMGSGAYFSQGKMVDIRWYKEDEKSATIYWDKDGNVLEMNPGKTWICFIEEDYLSKNTYYTTVEEFKN